ncbi:MAG: hypothetical protein IJZ64_02215 [Ruminococcus sp.]|nr:hypothetical protein [Ruminococcus sp.]
MDYTDEICIVCNQKFKKDEDIVVCPDCGTPYHRACWKKEGHCINTSLHESGQSWRKVNLHTEKTEEVITCPSCGTKNNKGNISCISCGKIIFKDETQQDNNSQKETERLKQEWENQFQQSAFNDKCCGLDPEEKYEGERLGDVAEFVEKNTIYYIPIFKKFRETGSKISINLISGFFPTLYFAHRKMWGVTIFIILFMFLLDIPTTLYNFATGDTFFIDASSVAQDYGSYYSVIIEKIAGQITKIQASLANYDNILFNISSVCSCIGIFVRILLCVFSNFIYYRFVLKNVRKIKNQKLPLPMTQNKLRASGGTSIGFAALAIIIEYVLTLFVSMLAVVIIGSILL